MKRSTRIASAMGIGAILMLNNAAFAQEDEIGGGTEIADDDTDYGWVGLLGLIGLAGLLKKPRHDDNLRSNPPVR